jgi:phosphorylcholine metabolism protein LicD
LGAVKVRGVLPWDAGDVDIFVYYKNPSKLFKIVSKFAKEYDFVVNVDHSDGQDQIQLYCAPSKIGSKMGGLVSLFIRERN